MTPRLLLIAAMTAVSSAEQPLPALRGRSALLAASSKQEIARQTSAPSAFMMGNTEMPITFETIAGVTFADLLVYLMLPEGERFGILARRLPRLVWSLLMGIIALANANGPPQPWLALLLAMLLFSSAATDLLFWVPYYAWEIEWEKCTGGLFTKRTCVPHNPYDRFILFALCAATGIFYLLASVHTFGVFTFWRDEEKERRMRRSFSSP